MIHSAAHAEGLVITSPLNGAVLPMQRQAIIEAQFEPPEDLVFTGVQARVEAVRGGEHFIIAEGDLRSLSSPNELRAEWDVAGFAPGDYTVTVTATAGGRTGKDSVVVTVHPIPLVSLRVASLQNVAGGTRVTYSATAHSPVGSAIREFIWTPGDGSPSARTTTGSFSHLYLAGNASFIVWVEVNDALGGSTLIARDLNLPGGPTGNEEAIPPLWHHQILRETDDCGCKEMVIRMGPPAAKPPPKNRRMTGVYCAPKGQTITICKFLEENPGPPDRCPEKTDAYRCSLGGFSPEDPRAGSNLAWRFEVVAKLAERTNNPDKCSQGQYAKITNTIDREKPKKPILTDKEPPSGKVTLPDGKVNPKGFTFMAIEPNKPFPPFGGQDYGADDYAHERFDKRHLPDEFRWTDIPRIGVVRGKAPTSLTQENEFIDFVKGNLGTCWCRFSINQEWTKEGGVKLSELKLIDSSNCSIEKP